MALYLKIRPTAWVIALIIATLPTTLQAQRMVADVKSTEAVIENTVIQSTIEHLHNAKLDSINNRQQKIEEYAATMAVITEAYKITLENIKGFGTESKYYVEIGLCSYDIATRIPRLTKVFANSKIPGKILCIKELTDLYSHTVQLVTDFVNIVNNAKIESPLKSVSIQKKSDGYNFLDRYDRISVANRIYSDLLRIKYKLEAMEMMAQYATWDNVFRTFDPTGWASVMTGKHQVEYFINRWKGL